MNKPKKVCPEGSFFNPETGRCNKNKKVPTGAKAGRPRLDPSKSQDPTLIKNRLYMRKYNNKKNNEIIDAIEDGENCDDNLIDAKKQIAELKSDKRDLTKLLKEADAQLLATVGTSAFGGKKSIKLTKQPRAPIGLDVARNPVLNRAAKNFRAKRNDKDLEMDLLLGGFNSTSASRVFK